MKKIGLLGSTGKMGKALISLSSSPFHMIPLFRQSTHLAQDPFRELSALLDFSHVDALQKNLQQALAYQLPIVIGTTGHTETTWNWMQEASVKIPVLYSSNFSIGITLIKKFIALYAPILNSSYVDIFETHHTEKKDLPSGTALDLARLLSEKEIVCSCPPSRSVEDLIIHPQRLPSRPGAHTVQFAFQDETLSLHHHVLDRKVYAQGALTAVEFLLNKNPGLYSFADVFAT